MRVGSYLDESEAIADSVRAAGACESLVLFDSSYTWRHPLDNKASDINTEAHMAKMGKARGAVGIVSVYRPHIAFDDAIAHEPFAVDAICITAACPRRLPQVCRRSAIMFLLGPGKS